MSTWDDKPNDYEQALLWIDEQNGQLALMRGALEHIRANTIEECARVADSFAALHKDVPAFRYAAAAIRALKDKP